MAEACIANQTVCWWCLWFINEEGLRRVNLRRDPQEILICMASEHAERCDFCNFREKAQRFLTFDGADIGGGEQCWVPIFPRLIDHGSGVR